MNIDDKEKFAGFIETIQSNFKVLDRACLYLSSFLAQAINDETQFTANVYAGKLEVDGRIIFSDTPVLHALDSLDSTTIGSWDGHAWVQVSELILDPSVFFTIFSPASKADLQTLFLNKFKQRYDFLIVEKDKLRDMGVIYHPMECFEEKHIDLLINSAFQVGIA